MTAEQRQRERAVFLAFFYDCLLIPPYLWIAISVGSLTMLAEVLRGILLVAVAVLSWVTLRKIHRGRTGDYDFGMGKVEQVLSSAVAVLLCISMGFVWYKALGRGAELPHAVSALNIFAVGLVFANLAANAAPLLPLYRANRTGNSVLVRTQLRAKLTKTIGSLVVSFCVALNQLSDNMVLSWWADIAGLAIVTLVTLHAAYELLAAAIPDLLDRTLPEDQQIKINQVLARHYDSFDALKWCQSRRAGSAIEVHVGLGFAEHLRFGEVAGIARAVVKDIEQAIPGSRARVTPVLPD